MDENQIIDVIQGHLSTDGRIKDTKKAAEAIAFLAEEKSLNKDYLSPFAKKAKQHGYRYKGGKPDDITVVVAQLSSSEVKQKWEHHDLL